MLNSKLKLNSSGHSSRAKSENSFSMDRPGSAGVPPACGYVAKRTRRQDSVAPRRSNLFGQFSIWACVIVGGALLAEADPATLPVVKEVDLQPLAAQVRRVGEALNYLGAPLLPDEQRAIDSALTGTDSAVACQAIQRVLDPHCLVGLTINPEMRVKVAPGPAAPELVADGWRTFLVKVQNDAGATAELRVISPQAQSVHDSPWARTASDRAYAKSDGADKNLSSRERWLDLEAPGKQPLRKELSGLGLEYRIVSLYSRDAGKREAKLVFDVGQGTQDLGFRSELDLLFNCLPAHEVKLRVFDETGQPSTAMFIVKDRQQRVYPSQAKRLAPDFAFHPQIYRADGENFILPAGKYIIEYTRGPEYIAEACPLEVKGPGQTATFQLRRWIDPSKFGWWSGDHHIHAAGCAHYTQPTEGVLAVDMYRHCQGEDLKVGCNLTWGPCFDFQKQFFTGKDDTVSRYPYLLHYDIEVSGFGSHQSGHLVLLRLKDEIYPGGDSDKHWPTLCLNTLRWAKKQGAVCGPAHSGWGLEVDTSELPNYVVPPYSGIGANEYIVDVTHQVPGPDGKLVPAVDFMSMVDTPSVWELNMWYHTLNVGFRTRISGETDFPCIYGERVGLGRSYVKLGDKLTYDAWCEGIREGHNYVSDGRSHLMDFKIDGAVMGENGSELRLAKPAMVHVTAKVAALLDENSKPEIKKRPYSEKPYWDIERARLDDSRHVPLELIVNGYPVARKEVNADGSLRDVTFDVQIDKSSWVALRILPSSHTNPIFVLVDGKPIRASRRSAQWCLDGVDRCWQQKQRFIKSDEMSEAKAAYEYARQTYRQLIAECDSAK
ncbi:MAG TPA: CehA/McbA family metallohydrolase [Verrucomicrobiae bacterium]|nr:CehA/McbA family metallohydrolase [Verrucomicrobiae bacterium]